MENLPAKHIDTGMGFERLCMALQQNLLIMIPMFYAFNCKSGRTFWRNIYRNFRRRKDIAIHVVVDHIRAVSFAIADGQLPSNGGAGYVIRRIFEKQFLILTDF